MASVQDYVKNYGNISFTEKPFCPEDAVAMCMSFYMPLDKVVSPSFDDEPRQFDEACRALYEYRGGKHKPVGLVLVKGISKLLMNMAEQKRYSEMKVLACTETYNAKPAVQFNSATYFLPDGKIVVLFRGTDDTLAGWKEDLDILASKDGIPSEPLALEYLKEVATRFEGDIIVCGHSKGGYVAQYAVLNTEPEIRERIVEYYNLDGPGMPNYDYISEDVYKEMLPKYRHYIPQSSLIGMMLAHDDDYKVVKSRKLTGPMQHDMLTWCFNGDKLHELPGVTNICKKTDLIFYDLRNNCSDEQISATERALGAVIEGIGQRGLLDVKSHAGSSLKGGKRAYKNLDEETKATLKETMKYAKKAIKKASKEVKSGNYRTVAQRLEK